MRPRENGHVAPYARCSQTRQFLRRVSQRIKKSNCFFSCRELGGSWRRLRALSATTCSKSRGIKQKPPALHNASQVPARTDAIAARFLTASVWLEPPREPSAGGSPSLAQVSIPRTDDFPIAFVLLSAALQRLSRRERHASGLRFFMSCAARFFFHARASTPSTSADRPIAILAASWASFEMRSCGKATLFRRSATLTSLLATQSLDRMELTLETINAIFTLALNAIRVARCTMDMWRPGPRCQQRRRKQKPAALLRRVLVPRGTSVALRGGWPEENEVNPLLDTPAQRSDGAREFPVLLLLTAALAMQAPRATLPRSKNSVARSVQFAAQFPQLRLNRSHFTAARTFLPLVRREAIPRARRSLSRRKMHPVPPSHKFMMPALSWLCTVIFSIVHAPSQLRCAVDRTTPPPCASRFQIPTRPATIRSAAASLWDGSGGFVFKAPPFSARCASASLARQFRPARIRRTARASRLARP